MDALLLTAVVEDDVEAARRRDDQLTQRAVGVARSFCSTWYVVEVIDPLDVEVDSAAAFDESEVPAAVLDLR